MAVIAIVAAATIGALQLRPRPLLVEDAANRLAAMSDAARSQAILGGVPARLLVNYDPNDSENYMRQLSIVVETEYGSNLWRTVDRGAKLPAGVFIDPARSVFRKNITDDAIYFGDLPSNSGVALSSGTERGANTWIAVGFEPNGRIVNEVSSNEIVIAPGGWSSGILVFDANESAKKVSFKPSGFSVTTDEP